MINIETAIDYMYSLKNRGIRYSMTGSRTGSDGTGDCSGTIYQGLRNAGATDAGWVLNTDSMHNWLIKNNFDLIAANKEWNAKRGDIVIFGLKGSSGGENGHVVIFINNTQIIHCTWKNENANGVYVDNEATTCPYDMGWYVYRLNNQTSVPQKPSKPKPTIKQGSSNPTKKGLEYRVHIPDQGDLGWVKQDEIAGTTGKGIQVQSIELLYNGTPDLITGKAHVQDIGWMPWGYELTGTKGKNKKLEACQFWLGELLTKQGYSIHYQAHIQDIGWQGWKKDGAIAGTTGKNKGIEAIRIKLVKK